MSRGKSFSPCPPILYDCFAIERITVKNFISVSVGGLNINKPPTTPNAPTAQGPRAKAKRKEVPEFIQDL